MKYYIIAGEASGDLHASNLIKELTNIDSEAEVRAWGGDKMKSVGANLVKHYKNHNFMGFVEVLMNIKTILKNLKWCKNDIKNYNPDVIILIDFPGFNLQIASWAKKQNFKVIYYISPQIWAWKASRIHTIKRSVDKMIVILPFEKDFYSKYNYDAIYVGHPLLDAINQKSEETNANKKEKIIALLPGSRKQEIEKMLPTMIETSKYFPEYKFIVAGVDSIQPKYYQKLLPKHIDIIYNKTYDLLQQSDIAIVTSGTATLEAALLEVPQIVCYKSNYISYLIAKRVIKVKYISLVNLIFNKKIVQELIQKDMNVAQLRKELEKICNNIEYRNSIFANYKKLKMILGTHGASKRAANEIFTYLNT